VQVLGPYAGGGIPDSWLVPVFRCSTNANAGPTVDPDGDGQKQPVRVHGRVVPTNPASLFVLRIQPVSGQPTQKRYCSVLWQSAGVHAGISDEPRDRCLHEI